METKNPIMIIECDFDGSEDGRYYFDLDIIAVKDIFNINILLHEMTHYLFYHKDENLENYLKSLKLNYNKRFNHFRKSQGFSSKVNSKFIMKNYPPSLWVEEAIAYHMSALSDEELKALNIVEYNNILDGNFCYWNKSCELVYKGNVIDFNTKLEGIIDFIKSSL